MIYLLRSRLTGLAALFEEASKCMLQIPSLIIPSLIALLVLAIFLTFWVAVVVCIATANYPESTSLAKQATAHDSTDTNIYPATRKELPRNNSGIDYKTFVLAEYRDYDLLRNMIWVYAIGLIWTCEFIFGKNFFNLYWLWSNEIDIFLMLENCFLCFSLPTIGIGWCSCILVF